MWWLLVTRLLCPMSVMQAWTWPCVCALPFPPGLHPCLMLMFQFAFRAKPIVASLIMCYPLPQWTFRLFVFAISVLVCVSICGRGPALASHSQLCSQSVACRIANSEGCSRSHQHNLVQRRPKGRILRSPRFGSSMSVFRGALLRCFIFWFSSGFLLLEESL